MEKVTVKELLKLSKDDLRGKIICFPTDTVYGVGAMADDFEAIKKIYKMKGRSDNKPLAILCSKIEQVEEYTYLNKRAYELARLYWPGALTIILKKKKELEAYNNTDTLAFRMPNSKIALQIIDHFSLLSTTSVNPSGEKEMNDYVEIGEKFSRFIDYLVIDKEEFSSVASTIVDLSGEKEKVIRVGSIKI